MKERPILFSAPMVRAILDGTKTQTRRVCKPQPHSVGDHFSTRSHGTLMIRLPGEEAWKPVPCRYGVPGDRLWVRETWAPATDFGHATDHFFYSASYTDGGCFDDVTRWKPSIHMPRRASRITLEITGVRVERLQDISEDDAKAEGVERHAPGVVADVAYRAPYRSLWEDINGAGSWDLNPWVWVVEFKRATRSQQPATEAA